jgi:hypothetical protein
MTAKEETPGQCTPDGPEVFFGFTLAAPSAVYLDVFDPTGKRVDVALEVWANNCPVAGSKPLVCNFDGGGACGGETWPRVFFTNTDLRTFVVAARATNGTRGRYTLRFQYVPLACIAAGAFPLTATQPLVDTTCGNADQYAPSCATPMTGGLDKTFYLVKCPAQTLSLSTCEGRTGNTDTVLLVNRGSMRVANGVCSAVPGGIGRENRLQRRTDGRLRSEPQQHAHLPDRRRRRRRARHLHHLGRHQADRGRGQLRPVRSQLGVAVASRSLKHPARAGHQAGAR